MTHAFYIESNIPLFFQCLRVPCEVGTDPHPSLPLWKLKTLATLTTKASERPTRLYWHPNGKEKADTYDPWEERRRFFQIADGDDESLIEFLRSVGFFQSPVLGSDPNERKDFVTGPDGQRHAVRYISEMEISAVWAFRRLIENSLRDLTKHSGRFTDFTARITLLNGAPRVTITTCTFIDSLLLTLAVDRVQKAKVRKCERPDCRVLFSTATRHDKKFCCWNCGHLESVRKQRRAAAAKKKKTSKRKGK